MIVRLIAFLERHPRVARALDQPPIVLAAAVVLNRINERALLDLRLRMVGAPPARWWETTERLQERLWFAVVFGA